LFLFRVCNVCADNLKAIYIEHKNSLIKNIGGK